MSGEDTYESAAWLSGTLREGAMVTSERISAIVHRLFQAGLALDSMWQSIGTDYGKRRADAAGVALEAAICDLRSLAITLEAGVAPSTARDTSANGHRQSE